MRAVDVGERRPERDAQEADAAEDARRARGRPAISRRMTRHQSREPHLAERQRADDQRRRLRAGVAAARDDERHEQREHDRLRDLRLEDAHRRRGQHFAEEQRRQPAGALLDHAPERDVHVGLVERFRSADPLDFPRRRRLGHVQHVVDRDDADEHAGGVGDRQRACGRTGGTPRPRSPDRRSPSARRSAGPSGRRRAARAAPAGTRGCGCRR